MAIVFALPRFGTIRIIERKVGQGPFDEKSLGFDFETPISFVIVRGILRPYTDGVDCGVSVDRRVTV